ANPGAPEILTLDASSPKSKTHGLARTVVATVTDVYGNPIRDAALRFSTKMGAVAPANVVSDAKGRAKVTWTLSPKAAEQVLTASLRGSNLEQRLELESAKK
ncbi:MAG TPA: Ig-like domain-containing protein, partial [Gemmatimonadaceae bacterium]|nr:Ig-like domain-containing protein [Gemmatimonadaceae bacterium]